jgi:hypothetical protein
MLLRKMMNQRSSTGYSTLPHRMVMFMMNRMGDSCGVGEG